MPPPPQNAIRQGPIRVLVVGATAGGAGDPPRIWPEPLGQWIGQGKVEVVCVPGMHEAAAELTACRGGRAYRVLLIDADYVTTAEIKMLQTIKRHVALPIGSLPFTRTRREMNAEVLPWEEATLAIAHFLPEASTRECGEGSSRNHAGFDRISGSPSPARPAPTPLLEPFILPRPPSPAPFRPSAPPVPPPIDPNLHAAIPQNPVSTTSSGSDEPVRMPVVSDVVARYDGFISQPILTPEEIQALLGSE